jgi:crotonobetainyl-CoA:carnitine CoA-transferase CaiB-like acyl-CoA transferase
VAFEQLSTRCPQLVVGSITPWGATGPYAEYQAEELTVIHASSWGFLSPSAATDITAPPLKAYGHHASIITGTVAATAVLAAFNRAERTGQGEHVDFSTFGAAARMTETAPVSATYQGQDASRLGVKTVVPWGIYQCRDGLMQFIAVEQSQWLALVELMGNPEWAQLEVFATNADRQQNADLVELYLSEWMAQQSVDELYRAGQQARLCMSPVYTMEQLGADEHFEARRFFAETPDGLRLTGPGFKTDPAWWSVRRPAAEQGHHNGQGWPGRPATKASQVPPSEPASPSRPLDGIRICDFTWIWAGPYCTQLLAHLGADVIRLESPDHPCLFRRLPFNPPDLPLTPDTCGLFHLYNSDKRSVALDIGHPGAHEVVRRLVTISDVVIDNFAVGTMAKLGFGVDDLRAMNPDVVVVSLSGYGQTGPSSEYMAYGPAGGAVAGLYAATGYEGDLARETGIAIGDPCTGITAAWATVAALTARRRQGEKARVDVAMVEAIATTIGEAWMSYVSDGVVPRPLGNHDPQWSPHNCYQAEGVDRWVTIACTSEAQWQALCQVVDPRLADDPRFADPDARKAHEDELDASLSAWTSTRDRWEITRLLQDVGVAAMPSISPLELWTENPQLEAIGMLERPDHPAVGRRTVPGIPWRLANGPNGLRRPAPMLGEHTREVLTELLGFDAAEVEDLVEQGVLPGLC